MRSGGSPSRSRRTPWPPPTSSGAELAAIGITNQRETTVIWDRRTGRPVHRAIVWQSRQTAEICDRLRAAGHEKWIHERTGLVLDAYFSATKIRWILDQVPDGQALAERGDLLFGTIDSWLLWKLTGGEVHATDPTNASRTLLYDIRKRRWASELLELFDVPRLMLPKIRPSSGIFGTTRALGSLPAGIPIAGIAGDQQAALYGQACWRPGMVKATYGTGSFVVLNMGDTATLSERGLVTTVCCDAAGAPAYALEGSIFTTGAAVQWLRDEMGLIETAAETETIGGRVTDTMGVYVVPAFAGLGAPLLGHARPRRRGRSDPRQRARPARPRHPRQHRLPGPRCRRHHESGLRGSRSPSSGSMAAPPPTTCSCSSRPTFSGSRWCVLIWSRPPPPAPPSWPASGSVSGAIQPSSKTVGAGSGSSNPRWTVQGATSSTTAGRER